MNQPIKPPGHSIRTAIEAALIDSVTTELDEQKYQRAELEREYSRRRALSARVEHRSRLQRLSEVTLRYAVFNQMQRLRGIVPTPIPDRPRPIVA